MIEFNYRECVTTLNSFKSYGEHEANVFEVVWNFNEIRVPVPVFTDYNDFRINAPSADNTDKFCRNPFPSEPLRSFLDPFVYTDESSLRYYYIRHRGESRSLSKRKHKCSTRRRVNLRVLTTLASIRERNIFTEYTEWFFYYTGYCFFLALNN